MFITQVTRDNAFGAIGFYFITYADILAHLNRIILFEKLLYLDWDQTKYLWYFSNKYLTHYNKAFC